MTKETMRSTSELSKPRETLCKQNFLKKGFKLIKKCRLKNVLSSFPCVNFVYMTPFTYKKKKIN